MNLVLSLSATAGTNQRLFIWRQLNTFVSENWYPLYLGAERLGLDIPEDHFTCERIQINNTRLHAGYIGNPHYMHESESNIFGFVKIADGWHWCNDATCELTDSQLEQTVSDIQQLIDAASKVINLKQNISIS